MRDILIFLWHKTSEPTKENYILDIGHDFNQADPYLDLETGKMSTGLCRNVQSNSVQNQVYNFIQNRDPRNIYLIYYRHNTWDITFIMKVNKKQVYQNHREALRNGHRLENNVHHNTKLLKAYPRVIEHPYIMGSIVKNTLGSYRLTREAYEHYKLGYAYGGNRGEALVTGYIRMRSTLWALLERSIKK